MSEARTFTDEQLTAYLDREADESLRREIEFARTQDPNLEQRLKGLRVDIDALGQSFDAVLRTAPNVPDFLQVERKAPARSRTTQVLKIAACVCGLIALGGLVGWHMSQSRYETWQSAAATYHMLYVEQTLAPVQSSVAQTTAELERVSKALGRQIEESGLRGVAGLDYKRAQVLGYQGKPLVQLAFLTDDGVPVALCIIKSDEGRSKQMKASRLAGLNASSWTKDGYEFLLLGHTKPDRLSKFAEHFRARL